MVVPRRTEGTLHTPAVPAGGISAGGILVGGIPLAVPLLPGGAVPPPPPQTLVLAGW